MSTFLLIFKLSKIYLCFMNLLQICNSDKKKRMSTIHAHKRPLVLRNAPLAILAFWIYGDFSFFFSIRSRKNSSVRPRASIHGEREGQTRSECHWNSSRTLAGKQSESWNRTAARTSRYFRFQSCHLPLQWPFLSVIRFKSVVIMWLFPLQDY